MARIISSVITPEVEAIFDFRYNDTVKRVVIHENQNVKVSYVNSGEIFTLDGRVNRLMFERKCVNPFKHNKTTKFSDRYIITAIELDYSQPNQSKVIRIPVENIIEIHDFEIDEDFEQANSLVVKANLIAKVAVKLSDGTSSEREFRNGDAISELLYTKYTNVNGLDKDITITGTIEEIGYSIKGISNNSLSSSAKISECVEIGTFRVRIIGQHRGLSVILPSSIKHVGKRQYTLTNMEDIEETMGMMNDGEILRLPSGIITKSIYIDKSICIIGSNSGVDAFDMNEPAAPTEFTNILKFKEGVDVYLDGCRFSNKGYLTFKNNKRISIQNCVFSEIVPEVRHGSMISLLNNDDIECELTVCNSYFESWCPYGEMYINLVDYKIDNVIVAHAPLKASNISHNYFKKGCCESDNVVIHGIAEYSSIIMRVNTFEYAGNGILLATTGNPTGSLYIEDNTFLETLSDESAALLRIQPYSYYTESFENITVVCNGNKKPSATTPIFYLYYDENTNTKITQSKRPRVFVNGILEMKSIPETVMDIVH